MSIVNPKFRCLRFEHAAFHTFLVDIEPPIPEVGIHLSISYKTIIAKPDLPMNLKLVSRFHNRTSSD